MADRLFPIETELSEAVPVPPALSPELRQRVLALARQERFAQRRRYRLVGALCVVPFLCASAYNISTLMVSAWHKASALEQSIAERRLKAGPFLTPTRFAVEDRPLVPAVAGRNNRHAEAVVADEDAELLVEVAAEPVETVPPASIPAFKYSATEWDFVDSALRDRRKNVNTLGPVWSADKSAEIYGSWTVTEQR